MINAMAGPVSQPRVLQCAAQRDDHVFLDFKTIAELRFHITTIVENDCSHKYDEGYGIRSRIAFSDRRG